MRRAFVTVVLDWYCNELLSAGQYASLGPVAAYKRFCPLLRGLGYGMVLVSSVVMLYYNLIIAWTLFYMFASVAGTTARIVISPTRST